MDDVVDAADDGGVVMTVIFEEEQLTVLTFEEDELSMQTSTPIFSHKNDDEVEVEDVDRGMSLLFLSFLFSLL